MKLYQCIYMLYLLPATVFADTPINETRSLKPDGTVSISNVKGFVNVSAWDRSEVSLTGSLGEGSKGLNISGDENHLSIKVEQPDKLRWSGTGKTIFELKVPRQASLNIDVVSADVDVHDVAGKALTINSVSGDLILASGAKDVEIDSVSGDIKLNGSVLHTDIETVSGTIDLQGVQNRLNAETISGDISIKRSTLEELNVGTVSGEVTIETTPVNEARFKLESMSGNFYLILPATLSASLSAETFSGRLKSDFGKVEHEEFGGGSSLKFDGENSNGKISIKSFSGNIEVRSDKE